ncbi:MAG: M23 family metallopeptidase [Synergistaceae bacterium]|jgi:murein DD-endopeptidase MepM/ murein hydrolase activator NlpD|nr:M23 family metallopeptidase [Synergistaceae bacterium]
MLQKIRVSLSIFALAMLWASARPSLAEENWQTMSWDGDARKLEALCAERGIVSGDVFWANGYETGLPSRGETLLVPNSKKQVLPTWMEVQNRKNGSEPLVTVKLHGVPAALREAAAEPLVTVKLHGVPSLAKGQTVGGASAPVRKEPVKEPVAALPPTPAETPKTETKTTAMPKTLEMPAVTPSSSVKNMTIVVSGDQVIVTTPPARQPSTPKLTPETLASLPPLILNPPERKPPVPPRSITPTTSAGMLWPVSGKVSSGFGRRGKRRFHAGIDIPMPQGTPIAAAQDGVVLDIGTTGSKKYRGYGNAALVDHGNGVATMYAHCQSISVKKGQKIKRGDIVGLVGNTGRTTTHHVHFEVRKNGKPVDPLSYLASR